MTKFKVGDRVRVYFNINDIRNCVVKGVDGACVYLFGFVEPAHVKQCRRLIPKRPRRCVDHLTWDDTGKKEVRVESKDCPRCKEQAAKEPDHLHKTYSINIYPFQKAIPCPSPFCYWGRDTLDTPPNAPSATGKEPRRFWIEPFEWGRNERGKKYMFKEVTISDHHEENWIEVTEVLPGKASWKGE